MRNIKFLMGVIALAAIFVAGCQNESAVVTPDTSLAPEVTSILKANPRPQTWVDCERFDGVVTPATFNPESDPFDELYAIPGGSFLDGVPLISESKPGDQDYNGGRWHLNLLKGVVNPNKYATACTVEELDPDDFDSTDSYFECPLLPRRGSN